ncbi:hypothetical protein HanXRQr2_Chr17g0826251 [Helianthus annuus]|uniref:Uncharacterized protein n=1 Tax=Helianthus annuus TaxID=4232 RepID=A0A9K3DMK5_HELAN|nr:hypothetical protein HanXRQr2_Chr17g0826241 [Helianthus annuus]KAF5757400.1 hypothetical protein HanXRQr2_Chr17g0826251 [Helianthus annuus]
MVMETDDSDDDEVLVRVGHRQLVSDSRMVQIWFEFRVTLRLVPSTAGGSVPVRISVQALR